MQPLLIERLLFYIRRRFGFTPLFLAVIPFFIGIRHSGAFSPPGLVGAAGPEGVSAASTRYGSVECGIRRRHIFPVALEKLRPPQRDMLFLARHSTGGLIKRTRVDHRLRDGRKRWRPQFC
jgi:hypothetical protein